MYRRLTFTNPAEDETNKTRPRANRRTMAVVSVRQKKKKVKNELYLTRRVSVAGCRPVCSGFTGYHWSRFRCFLGGSIIERAITGRDRASYPGRVYG